jgi:hypothetical protein
MTCSFIGSVVAGRTAFLGFQDGGAGLIPVARSHRFRCPRRSAPRGAISSLTAIDRSGRQLATRFDKLLA